MLDTVCAAALRTSDSPVGLTGLSGVAPDCPVAHAGLSGVTTCTVLTLDAVSSGDWRLPFITYLCDPSVRTDRKVRQIACRYVLIGDDLYRRTIAGVLLKCLGPDDSVLAMAEVHEGICGTHQSALKMKWLLRRAGFYWPNMIVDCFKYYKGC